MKIEKSAEKFLKYSSYFVIVMAGVHLAKPIIAPFLLATFIAIVSMQIISFLESRGLPSMVAFSSVLLIGIILFFGIGVLVGSSFDEFNQNLPIYIEKLKVKIIESVLWLNSYGIEVSKDEIIANINPSSLFSFAAKTAGGIGSIATNIFLVLLMLTFMMFEFRTFRKKLVAIVGNSQESIKPYQEISVTINHYIFIKTLTSLFTGACITIMLVFFGVDYPIIWGLLAFMLNYIPTIGSILAAIPALLLAYISVDLQTFFWITLSYVIINNAITNLAEPKILGDELGLSPLVVFLSLVFWGWILGPIGMFLSVPLTMTLKIALDLKEETRWLGILLGSAKGVGN